MFKKACLGLLIAALAASTGWGQLSQTGSIVGKVKDAQGAPLPGVAVGLRSPAIIVSQLSTITNESGTYRFPSLAPGLYELTFTLSGFNTLVRKDIKIGVGQTSEIDATMEIRTLEEQVTVVGRAPTVDLRTTTKNVNLETAFLSSIPAVRDLSTFVNMTPGFTSDTSHGSSVRDNTYNLDGVNLGDPTVGTQAVFFGLDLMEEISVQSGGLSAEYGGVRGAMINVVSKSGGNTFSGAASFYFRNWRLQSKNTKGTPLAGRAGGFKYEIEPTLVFGGPIIKDKLWFFTNLSFSKNRTYVDGFPYDKTTSTSVGSYMPYPYIKFSFQPDQGNKFVLSYNYSDIKYDNRFADRFQTEDTTIKQVTPTHVFNFQWTRFFSDDLFANLRVGYVKSDFNMLAKTALPNIYEVTTGRVSGGYGNDDLNKRDRLQINVDGTRFLDRLAGSHELKFGGEFTYSWSYWGLHWNTDPRNGMTAINTWDGQPWYGTYYANLDKHENTMNMAAFVNDSWTINNRLTLNLGLRFEHQRGIIPPQNQSEGPRSLYGYTYNRSVTKQLTPLKWTTLAPRLGGIFDITGDGKTLLKASFSRYYAANITQWFSYLNPNDFVVAMDVLNPDWSRADSPFYLYVPGSNSAGYKEHKLKNPYIDEVTIGLEREVLANFSLGARYIKKWDRDLIEDANGNMLDMDALMDRGELVWKNWEAVTVTDPYDGSPHTFYNQTAFPPALLYTVNPPGADRNYDGVEVTMNKRFAGWWGLAVSYAYQNSRGLIGTDFNDSYGARAYFDDPNVHINAYGRMDLERRHQFKVQGMVKGPWDIMASCYYRYLSGQRYTRKINSTDLGLELNQGDVTIFAEKRGSHGLPAVNVLDLRLEKTVRVRNLALSVFVDGFNVFNANRATAVEDLSSNASRVFGRMTSIQNPRIFRLGAKFEF